MSTPHPTDDLVLPTVDTMKDKSMYSHDRSRLFRSGHPRHWLRLVSVVLVVAIFATLLAKSTGASAAPGDTGFRGPSFGWTEPVGANPNVGPTASKPQSKLWFNDGIWWGVLYNGTTTDFHIYRLDQQTQTWVDTGVLVDERRSGRADALWDGTKLYIATAGPDSANANHSARFLQYSYDPSTKRYSVDPGFPVTITTGGLEAVVVAKDTTGKFWVTFTQNARVFVNRSLNNSATWGTPFVLPASGTSVTADDISAIIAFKSKIGVMWSNQIDETMYFSTHKDGDPDDVWGPSVPAFRGPKYADDHISLRELKNDSAGEVFAVIKTGMGDLSPANPDDPQIVVLTLQGNALWGPAAVFSTVQVNDTRPILMIDEQNRELYVFASSNSGEPPSSIVYKKSSLDKISFPPGPGTPFIQLASDTNLNNATSTKQNVTNATGLVVLASDITTGFYAHNSIRLGAAPSPTSVPPTATPTTQPTASPSPSASSTSSPANQSAYSNAVLGTSGLVSYWRLGEQTGTTGADLVSGNTANLSNVMLGAAGALSGDADKAMTFNGTSSYAEISKEASLNLTGDLTLEAWVKPSAVDTTSRTVLAKAASDGAFASRQFRLGMSEGRWRGTLYNTGGSTFSAIASAAPVSGTWQHVVVTVSGNTIRIYVNGVQSGSATFSGTRTSVTSGAAIGRLGDTAAQYFGGTVDEVAIYNTALSATLVQEHYNIGARVVASPTATTSPPTATSVPPTATPSPPTATPTVEATSTPSPTTPPPAATPTVEATATPSPTTPPPAATPTVEATATPSPTGAPTQRAYNDVVRGTAGLVSYWRLDEQSGTTAADVVSGNNGALNHPTLGATGALAGNANAAMDFNGTSSFIDISKEASLNLTGDLTLEAWVKPSTVDGTSRTILAKASADGSFTSRQFRLGMSENRWRGTLYNTSGSTFSAIASTAPVVGTWHHLVVTVSGNTIRIYVNGVQSGTATFSGTRTSVTSGTGIGRLGDNPSQYFGGMVDEVAIYNTALTDAQIQEHYKAGSGLQ